MGEVVEVRATGLQMSIEIEQKDLDELLKNADLMTPVEAGFDAPYAQDVEYGTSPGTVVPYDDIYDWVGRKLGITDKRERAATTQQVIDTIYEKGQRPQPFFKPAQQATTASNFMFDIRNEGVYAIARELVSRAQVNIEEQGITDTGRLVQSGYCYREGSMKEYIRGAL